MATVPSRKLLVVIFKEDDLFVAECTEVGTVSQGATIDEAVANLKEATALFVEEFPPPAGHRPPPTPLDAT